MAKSQETFNKKEKEKKRLKKQQDKKDKKEERKANAGKGKDLDDMLAYVDENGNITSTPPDPNKKRTINSEDIQIGVARQEDIDPASLIRTGTVTFFNEAKGYGFIKDLKSQDSVFVHVNALKTQIKQGDKVSFDVEMTPKGPSAIGVELVQ
ncbi:cold shock domain-containing protein [Nibrella viscosa]|uniref:Cold shock domain-containing protein n=1 Tax=Nibrella viscosa TaxID=1084524 RepID=A0ABP8KAB2_9BACT